VSDEDVDVDEDVDEHVQGLMEVYVEAKEAETPALRLEPVVSP
jgi:hypothetical protein